MAPTTDPLNGKQIQKGSTKTPSESDYEKIAMQLEEMKGMQADITNQRMLLQMDKLSSTTGDLYHMPQPGARNAKLFDGTELTTHLRWYNMICVSARLQDGPKISMFPSYCADEVTETIVTTLEHFETEDWPAFEKELRNAFRHRDSRHGYGTIAYLENLAAGKRSTEIEIKAFITLFRTSIKRNPVESLATNYQLNTMFLKGCGEWVSKKVLKALEVTSELNLSEVSFDKVSAKALSYVESNEVFDGIFKQHTIISQEELLLKHLQSASHPADKKTAKFADSNSYAQIPTILARPTAPTAPAALWNPRDLSRPARNQYSDPKPAPVSHHRRDSDGDILMGNSEEIATVNKRMNEVDDNLAKMMREMRVFFSQGLVPSQPPRPAANYASNGYSRETRPAGQPPPIGECWACHLQHRGIWQDCEDVKLMCR
jgi:hypothetical protein